jgi:PAS domain S-box-containing protein
MNVQPGSTTLRQTESSRRGLSWPWLLAALVFAIATSLVARVIIELEQDRRALQRKQVVDQLTQHAQVLQQRINHNLSAAYTLSTLVRQGRGTIAEFEGVAGEMLPLYPGVASLQLAPKGVIRQIVPLAGNEAAIGHDLLQDPSRNKEAFVARDTGALTLAGPFQLLQGGDGAVGRLPVFLAGESKGNYFWGFVTVLMRFPDVLADLGPQLTAVGLDYKLWRKHPDSGDPHVILGSSPEALIEPVNARVALPNQDWTLSATPTKGWGDRVTLAGQTLVGLSCSFLLAFLAKLLAQATRGRRELETLVARRTCEIVETQRRLQATLAAIPDLMFELGVDARIHDVHSSCEHVLGLHVEQLPGRLISEVVSADAASATLSGLARALEQGGASGIQVQLPVTAGIRWFECSIARKEVAPRHAPRFILIARDITERKWAEQELRDSRERLQLLLDSMAEGAYGVDTRGNCTFVNRAFLDILGYAKADDVLGRHIHELIHHSHADGSPYPSSECKMYTAYLCRRSVHVSDEVFWNRDGTPIPVSYWSNPMLLHDEVVGAICTFTDITERKAADNQLRKLALALEQSPESIIISNLDAEIEYVNDTFVRNSGYTREEVIGRNPRFLRSGKTQPDTHAEMWKTLSVGQPWKGEFHNKRKDGTEYDEIANIAPLRQPDGRITHYVAVKEDITEKKRIAEELDAHRHRLEALVAQRTQELEAARRQADAANSAKSAFLATMSHEIRTPMNGVFGMLELLSLTRLDAEQRTTLEVVRQSSRALLRLIDDILDFSKIEAGKLEIRPEVASVRQVLQDVRNIYDGLASSKGLHLTHSIDPQISPALCLDVLRLRQILNNFVSNAIKFTAEGKVEIRAELVARSDSKERLRFTVQDTGIGISAENQQRLFQPFGQGNSDAARQAGGTGLGLTICRRLAEMMGGSVEMVSTLGEGSTLILTLSLPIADPAELRDSGAADARDLLIATTSTSRHAPTVAQAETEGTLVLLVDDHPTNRTLLMRQVHALGYVAESAEDGEQALDQWKSGRFGIVITDCNMPLMDGFELARNIRRLESARGARRTPIIACTANALAGEAERCLAAGMDDYLAKPIGLAGLFQKLSQWLPLPKGAEAPSATVELAEAALPPSATPFDRSLIVATWGADQATMRAILTEFRRFNDGDAEMLRQAVDSADMAQVTHATHRMLGASKMIGASDFAAVCERIQRASRLDDRKTVTAEMRAFHAEWTRLNGCIDGLVHS